MHLLWFAIIGIIAGALAKALMPGSDKEPKGCLMTMVLGIVGSILVGLIMDVAFGGGNGGFIGSIIGATIGAMLLIFLMRKFWHNGPAA
jgi:uncharacterized membrane protein YeaQ/YmgE (transglycosylase-associated protein family)